MNNALLTSNKDDWCTPQALFDELDREFHFDLDAAASHENAKCKHYFTKETDGLKNSWGVRYFATLRMDVKLLSGYGKRQTRRRAVQRLLCLLPRVLTQSFFTNTYTRNRMLKSDL